MSEKIPTVYLLGWGQKELSREDAEKFAAVGKGWRKILVRALLDHIDFFYTRFHITQIKEKFGGLRFYAAGGTYREGIEHYVGYGSTAEYIEFAEKISYYICETCGLPGRRREGGWTKTLCDEHAEENK